MHKTCNYQINYTLTYYNCIFMRCQRIIPLSAQHMNKLVHIIADGEMEMRRFGIRRRGDAAANESDNAVICSRQQGINGFLSV